VSEANHDLIRLLDKPGVSAYSVYKEISFFELGVGSASSRSALFSRRENALTWGSGRPLYYGFPLGEPLSSKSPIVSGDTIHKALLPHHAAHGSVLRDSADQPETDPVIIGHMFLLGHKIFRNRFIIGSADFPCVFISTTKRYNPPFSFLIYPALVLMPSRVPVL